MDQCSSLFLINRLIQCLLNIKKIFPTVPHSQSIQAWMISLSNQKCPKALFGKTEKHETLRVIHYNLMLGGMQGTPGKHIDPIVKGLICTTITNDIPSIKTLIISLSLWRNKNNLWCLSSTHPQTDRDSVENLIQMSFSWVHRQDVNIIEWNIGWATGL